jgi:hypothetical protein
MTPGQIRVSGISNGAGGHGLGFCRFYDEHLQQNVLGLSLQSSGQSFRISLRPPPLGEFSTAEFAVTVNGSAQGRYLLSPQDIQAAAAILPQTGGSGTEFQAAALVYQSQVRRYPTNTQVSVQRDETLKSNPNQLNNSLQRFFISPRQVEEEPTAGEKLTVPLTEKSDGQGLAVARGRRESPSQAKGVALAATVPNGQKSAAKLVNVLASPDVNAFALPANRAVRAMLTNIVGLRGSNRIPISSRAVAQTRGFGALVGAPAGLLAYQVAGSAVGGGADVLGAGDFSVVATSYGPGTMASLAWESVYLSGRR